ncbi:MAG: sugar phosphotransferase [Chloroflexi bacterium]|nr:sugar phosphotransferase [Chloroflexota bacterium]
MHTAETLRAARWFGGKSRAMVDARLVDSACWAEHASVSLVEVAYASGPSETYVLTERFEEPEVGHALLRHFVDGATLPTERGGALMFRPTHILPTRVADGLEPVELLRGEQSNTSLRFGDTLILKLFRRLQFGPNPDVEIGWFLTEHTGFAGTPPVAGSLTYTSPEGQDAALALLQQFVPNRGDAWTTTLARVRSVVDGAPGAESLRAIARLGTTTGELHVALASATGEFAPEPISAADLQVWQASLEAEIGLVTDALAAHAVALDPRLLRERAAGLAALEGSLKIRHHGDYHLGQVLERLDGDYVIIDFEGEPTRPLALRREKRSPLRDVAGMLRSFDYARHAALRASGRAADHPAAHAAAAWYAAARQAFLEAYLLVARGQPRLVPETIEGPLGALELEKAAYEVIYELNNRPDWLPIPLAAFAAS